MSYTVNIYGRKDSKSPDIIYQFNIGEHLTEGKWHHSVIQKGYKFNNELIDELTEDSVISEITSKIEEILNSTYGRELLISPILHLYYDDELKKPVAVFK